MHGYGFDGYGGFWVIPWLFMILLAIGLLVLVVTAVAWLIQDMRRKRVNSGPGGSAGQWRAPLPGQPVPPQYPGRFPPGQSYPPGQWPVTPTQPGPPPEPGEPPRRNQAPD